MNEFLEALWETELNSDKTGIPAFASQTTLQALRMTLFSTIELTDHLLSDDIGYDFVLTGKFNQDCIEVYTDKTISYSNILLIFILFLAFFWYNSVIINVYKVNKMCCNVRVSARYL